MFTSVTKQLKRAMSAVKSVQANAGSAAATLDPQLTSYLQEGEQIDGVEPILLTLVRWIAEDNHKLEECEAVQRSALRKLKRLRLRRDERQKTLYTKLIRIRKTFEDAFGLGNAAIFLGLEPRLDEAEPTTLRRQAQETIGILQDPQFSPPTPVIEGMWENPEQYAEQIQEALTPFQAALDEIGSQQREVEKTQKAKNDLLEQLGDRLKWSIRCFEAIYQLAGLGFHAERLRVTFNSRTNSGQEPETSGGDPSPAKEGDNSSSEPVQTSGDSDA